jgi:hypothetical protein
MKTVAMCLLLSMIQSVSFAQGNTTGACLDKVSEAAIQDILNSANGGGGYTLQSAAITNRLQGVKRIEDAKQDVLLVFETWDASGRTVKKFMARTDINCDFSLTEVK